MNYYNQYDQGCYRIDWMGKPHLFVRCISCLHLEEDCRYLRNTRHLILIHSDEAKEMKQ